MSRENKAVVRRFFQLLERDLRVPEELLGPGFIYHVPGVPPIDVDAIQERAAAFSAAFSDASRIEDALIAEGDLVAFRSTIEMTHTGQFMGAVSTGERISVVEMGFFRIANGKIAEMWGLLDTMGLLTQVGAMPKTCSRRSTEFGRATEAEVEERRPSFGWAIGLCVQTAPPCPSLGHVYARQMMSTLNNT